MFDVDEPISDYQKTIRERASQSLGSLRYVLNSPLKSSTAPTRSVRDNYTAAVTRLKTLLQQYDNSNRLDHQSFPSGHSNHLPNTEEIIPLLNNQVAIVQYLEEEVEFYKNALEALKQQTELVIKENETLFDQLKTQAITHVLAAEDQPEKVVNEDHSSTSNKRDSPQNQVDIDYQTDIPSGSDRGEGKISGVSGSASLAGVTTQKLQTQKGQNYADKRQRTETVQTSRLSVMPNVSLRTSFKDSSQEEALDSQQLFLSAKEKRFVSQLEEEVEKIRKLHETKARHLESLLYSTRDELEDYQRQVSQLEAKVRAQQELAQRPVICVMCGNHSAMFSSRQSEATVDTINKLTRERDDLLKTLSGQKAVLAEVRQREFEAYNQVKKSCHMVEQAQLEKAQAVIHVYQLKEDLQNERQRHDKYMKSSNEKMEKECAKIRADCCKELNALLKQVESSNESRLAVENQLERVTREKVDLTSELEHAKCQIIAHASEMSEVGQNVHKELEQTLMKYSVASQEVASLKSTAQQTAREREQEKTRLAVEIEGLRRRLQDAEHGWMESKEECIALTEQLNKVEREAKSAIASKEKLEKGKEAEMENVNKQNRQREEQWTNLLQETETRHTQCRTELQQILETEIQVCNQMKEECKKLTQQLQDSSDKSRGKILEAKEECNKLRRKLEDCLAEQRTVEELNTRKDNVIQELSKKLRKSDENSRKQIEQMFQLLATRNTLMKERKVLSQEVEFLRKQWLAKPPPEAVTPVETGSNASNEDADIPDESKQPVE